jgi:hypothetical protein
MTESMVMERKDIVIIDTVVAGFASAGAQFQLAFLD